MGWDRKTRWLSRMDLYVKICMLSKKYLVSLIFGRCRDLFTNDRAKISCHLLIIRNGVTLGAIITTSLNAWIFLPSRGSKDTTPHVHKNLLNLFPSLNPQKNATPSQQPPLHSPPSAQAVHHRIPPTSPQQHTFPSPLPQNHQTSAQPPTQAPTPHPLP